MDSEGSEVDRNAERIRQRAYELWQQSGQPDGSEMDFWLQAEREIKGEEAKKSKIER